jgi:hypothetical protein
LNHASDRLFDTAVVRVLRTCLALRCALAADQSAGCRRNSGRRGAGGSRAESALITAPTIEEYFREAQSWDADRAMQFRRSARTAWWVAGAGWVCAVTSASALCLLMPLKRVDPFVVRVDNSTGIVDVVPVYAGRATPEEAVTR